MSSDDLQMVCLCCGKPVGTLDNADGATSWSTRGNYGSTLYDPIGGGAPSYLVAFVCDGCLKERADRVVSAFESRPRPTRTLKRGIAELEDGDVDEEDDDDG